MLLTILTITYNYKGKCDDEKDNDETSIEFVVMTPNGFGVINMDSTSLYTRIVMQRTKRVLVESTLSRQSDMQSQHSSVYIR